MRVLPGQPIFWRSSGLHQEAFCGRFASCCRSPEATARTRRSGLKPILSGKQGQMRRVKERADAGFTLIEVLVALCMLGLISSYSLAALQNLRRMDMIIERIETRSSI